MLPWLKELGFGAYLYAPKADAHLRKRWQAPWPQEELELLKTLASACEAQGLEFCVGLSPMELYRAYDQAARDTLKARVDSIVNVGATGLGLLFDDMPGSMDSLAERQGEICADVRSWTAGLQLRLCPTYYSDDPILDKVFGSRPQAYLEDLGARLDPSVELFWTGPQVCSETVSADHLQRVSRLCDRPLALWDNYPVNDSRLRSEHLYFDGLSGRSLAGGAFLASHWCNAMNQSALSLPALASLPALYGAPQGAVATVLAEAGISGDLLVAARDLSQVRREDLSATQKASLEPFTRGESLAAQELRSWLAGAYVFDPACLTD